MRRTETDQSCERCGGTGKREGYGKCVHCGGHGSIRMIRWTSAREGMGLPNREMTPSTDYKKR